MVYAARDEAADDDNTAAGANSKIGAGDAQGSQQKGTEWDTDMDLDIDGMVRQEIAWLKADGYLAGQASFFSVCYSCRV
jgi:hypothetical protein